MRPETLALTFTKRLGLTSPDAVTTWVRVFFSTLPVWTVIFLRFSRDTEKPTTLPMTASATTAPRIFFVFGDIRPPRCSKDVITCERGAGFNRKDDPATPWKRSV